MEPAPLKLDTLGHGAATELFDAELVRVLENILDPNTDATTKRTITLQVTIHPSVERDEGSITIVAKSKLAPFRGSAGAVFIGMRKGRVIATTYDPKQMQIEWDKETPTHSIPQADAK